jgi:hypothetical protein
MKRRVAAVAVATALLLVGCAGQTVGPPAAGVRDDAFLPYHLITTTSLEAVQPGGDRIRAQLTARRDKATGAVTTHAILGVVYAQKTSRHYEAARNIRAVALPFRQLFQDGAGCRRQDGCAHAELYQVDIPEADLRRALAVGEGYPVKLFGRAGHNTLFPIPKEIVAALFKELDAAPSAVVATKGPTKR